MEHDILQSDLDAMKATPDAEWTSTPPTEPGWYWCRHENWKHPSPGRIASTGEVAYYPFPDWDHVEWWPVPIEPPRREPR